MPRGKVADKTKSPNHWEYYKALEPDLSQEECEKRASFKRKSKHKRAIEYYQVNYPSLSPEEQESMRLEYVRSTYKNYPNHIEYYQAKFPDKTHEEHIKMLREYSKERNFQNINFYKKKYPGLSEEEYEKMLNDAKKSYTSKRPKLFGKNNPGHSSNCTPLERRQRSPKCIEFYDLRYPDKTDEEKQEMLKAHLKKNAASLTPEKHSTKIEYWLAKGYSEEEAKQKIYERQQTFSLEKCIQKYGEEEGLRRFNERQDKWQKSLKKNFEENGDGRSPQSAFANNIIFEISQLLNLKSIKKEKYLTDKETNKHYAYDFCYKNIIIEFNGDYWHMNPYKYDENFFNKSLNMVASEKWEKDAEKINCAIKHGYKILTIWEDEYNKDYKSTINKCINFIKENVASS